VRRLSDGWFSATWEADARIKAIIHKDWKNAVESVVQLMPSSQG
jgi:hypothetical protein